MLNQIEKNLLKSLNASYIYKYSCQNVFGTDCIFQYWIALISTSIMAHHTNHKIICTVKDHIIIINSKWQSGHDKSWICTQDEVATEHDNVSVT